MLGLDLLIIILWVVYMQCSNFRNILVEPCTNTIVQDKKHGPELQFLFKRLFNVVKLWPNKRMNNFWLCELGQLQCEQLCCFNVCKCKMPNDVMSNKGIWQIQPLYCTSSAGCLHCMMHFQSSTLCHYRPSVLSDCVQNSTQHRWKIYLPQWNRVFMSFFVQEINKCK
jgi:hypothetical protein